MSDRLEEAMAAMADNMVETRNDIRRLYEAWPEQLRAVNRATEEVRRRSAETDAAMVHELRNIYARLDDVLRKLR